MKALSIFANYKNVSAKNKISLSQAFVDVQAALSKNSFLKKYMYI